MVTIQGKEDIAAHERRCYAFLGLTMQSGMVRRPVLGFYHPHRAKVFDCCHELMSMHVDTCELAEDIRYLPIHACMISY